MPYDIPHTVSPSLWVLAWRRLRSDRVAMVSLAIGVAYLIMMLLSAARRPGGYSCQRCTSADSAKPREDACIRRGQVGPRRIEKDDQGLGDFDLRRPCGGGGRGVPGHAIRRACRLLRALARRFIQL